MDSQSGRNQSRDDFREYYEEARQDRKCLKIGSLDAKLETMSGYRFMGGGVGSQERRVSEKWKKEPCEVVTM